MVASRKPIHLYSSRWAGVVAEKATLVDRPGAGSQSWKVISRLAKAASALRTKSISSRYRGSR